MLKRDWNSIEKDKGFEKQYPQKKTDWVSRRQMARSYAMDWK